MELNCKRVSKLPWLNAEKEEKSRERPETVLPWLNAEKEEKSRERPEAVLSPQDQHEVPDFSGTSFN